MIKPTKKIIRLISNTAKLPTNFVQLVSVKYGYKIRGKRHYGSLCRLEENYKLGFVYGRDKDTYRVFTMTNEYIFVPEQLKLKTIVLEYINDKQWKKYNKTAVL